MNKTGVACLLAGISLATPAFAGDPGALVSLGVGGTDLLNQQARAAVDFRLEYRSGVSLLPFFENYFKVKPLAAFETTSRQAVFGGAGILIEVPLGPHFVLTPSFVPGVYGQGNGKKLGSWVEFRSTFEGGYVFDDGSRLTASFGHTSNAGLGRHNPGTEAFVVSFQVPLELLTGRH